MTQSTLLPGERVFASELTPPSPATTGYRLNHTMLQIKDPAQSLKFYADFLGMSLIFQLNTGLCSVYYLGYPSPEDKVPVDIAKGMSSRTGLLELVHIHEPMLKDASLSVLKESTSSSRVTGSLSFGHLGFVVPDVEQVLRRAQEYGYEVLKDTTDTSGLAMGLPADMQSDAFHSKFLAVYNQIGFLRDPDGYALEFLPQVVKR